MYLYGNVYNGYIYNKGVNVRKRIRKVHLRTDKTDSGLACNSTVFTPLLTSDLNEVTCNCCIFTDIFKDIASKKEKERIASSEELGVKNDDLDVFKSKPTNNIIKFDNVTVFKDGKHMEVTGLNREQYNSLFDFLKKKSIGFSGTTDKTEIIPAIESYETIVDFIKQNYNDLDETFPQKTQLEKEDLFTKYNLNATHKAFIKEYGEVEAVKQDNKNCFGCCFHFQSMHPESKSYIDCAGVKCIENKIKFRLKKEEIMSNKTELSINDGTPGKQISCYFSKLSVGDYFIYEGVLYRKIMDTTGIEPSIECVDSGNFMTSITGIYSIIKKNTVEMVEKVTIQYIRKEQ